MQNVYRFLSGRGRSRNGAKTLGALPIEDACEIARQVASGLAHVHNTQVVHGDIRPENILLVPKNDQARVIIIDFGSAKVRDKEASRSADFGTAPYATPEQFESASISTAADIYSLGVVLACLISGDLPGPGAKAILDEIKRNHTIPRKLVTTLSSMLDPAPSRRPTAAEIYRSLADFTRNADLRGLLEKLSNELDPLQPSREMRLEFLLDPGSASSEEIAELLYEMSKLYRLAGGRGIQFSITDAREPVFAEDGQ